MEAIQRYFCDICTEGHVIAEIWCPVCEEFLCKECNRHHHRAKISKKHATISVEQYKKLPSSLLVLRSTCRDHDEKYELFCTFHKHPCCVKCITEKHNDCRVLYSLHEALNNPKTHNSIGLIEQELSSIEKNLADIQRNCSTNLEKLDKQRMECLSEINSIRCLINKRLDKLENSIREDLEMKYKTTKKGRETLLDNIKIHKERVAIFKKDLEMVKQFATDYQSFLFVSEMENNVSETVKYLKELHETGNLDELGVRFDVEPLLMPFVKNTISFGSIVLHHTPFCLDMLSLQIDESKPVVRRSNSIDTVELIPKRKIDLPLGVNVTGITGCEILNDGRLLFVDFDNKRLLCTNENNESYEVMKFPGSPRDIANIDDNKIAVTIRDERMVVMVDLKTKKIVKRFDVISQCYGIDRVDDKLVVRLNHIGQFLILDLKGKIISRLHISGYYIQDVALFKGKIFCTDCEDHDVFCYDMNGDLLWKYTDDILRKPFGIGEDNHGNIYVAGRDSNNVIYISPDGHRNKEVLNQQHGLCEPYALHVNKNTNQLLVCNEFGGQAFLYDIVLSSQNDTM